MNMDEKIYYSYFNALLAGKRSECRNVVQSLLDGGIDLKLLYLDLFQRSMYEVGELWENNRITVANEHLATSVTESLLNLAYPYIFAADRTGKKAVISCSPNEFHQIGGKMAADIFELHGWDGHFLGASSSMEEMTRLIQEIKPDMVGLSLSLLSNIEHLKHSIEVLKTDFPHLNVLIGGQAFRWGGIEVLRKYSGIEYVSSLSRLEEIIMSSGDDTISAIPKAAGK